jgi:anti-anti-sigma factor
MEDQSAPPPSIEVVVEEALRIVALRGEHDLGTTPQIEEALASARSGETLLIDLSECTFIDSTVIATFLSAGRATEAGGTRLALVIPAPSHVRRTVELIRLGDLIPIHDSRADGIADTRVAE